MKPVSFSPKWIRMQLSMLSPLMRNLSLKTIRAGQDKIGELMEEKHRNVVLEKRHPFADFDAAWIIPKDVRREGVILYLHGGGYTCGSLDYALGFGSTLAVQTGTCVFAVGYRLAPEHPFPAALTDALTAYRYLLAKGYSASRITLCGESAGGGLCYALCMRLKAENVPLPSGIIALSPWVDLTLSGPSYTENRDVDPSMSEELLRFFATSYTDTPENPFASPLFGDLSNLPPSLLFVGEDEIMKSDAEEMHRRLTAVGCRSHLVVTKERWHAYLLYGLKEDQKDFTLIGRFLNQTLSRENKLRWLRLDNAAKIYPAARRQNWSNVFRLSATLTEEVDIKVLKSALDVTVRRFPSMAVALKKGLFWYYLEQLSEAPEIREENAYPLSPMSKEETHRCAFRVIAYKKRIALEVFHSLTDGTGALVFLKSLLAEYLEEKHGLHIPAEKGVVGRLDDPSEEELEDSFLKHAGAISASRKENTAWHVPGTPEYDGFLHLTCFTVPVEAVLNKAHAYGVSLTAFLTSVMMMALQELQKDLVPNIRRRRPIKVLIPVNLRNLFGSRTLRNFALYTTPEILPRLGEYSFEEITKIVHHHMGVEITKKQMSMKIATNVNSEKLAAVRIMPLFVKNLVMKAIFDSVGEKKSCLTVSNLGNVQFPDAMKPYIQRLDFILGAQATAPHNCGVITYGDTLYINFIRNSQESALEYRFFTVLRDLSIPVEVQSNHREK